MWMDAAQRIGPRDVAVIRAVQQTCPRLRGMELAERARGKGMANRV
jgi:hypothetical protein